MVPDGRLTATRQQPDRETAARHQPDHWQTRPAQATPKAFYDCGGPAEATLPLRKLPVAAQTPRMRDVTGGNGQPDAEGRLARLKQRSGCCGLCCCIIRDFTSHRSRRPVCTAHQDSRVLNDEEWRASEAEFWEEQVDPNAVKRRRVDSANQRHAKHASQLVMPSRVEQVNKL